MATPDEEERLSALMLFQSLGPHDAGEMNSLMESEEIPDGHRLFEEGDAGDGLYIIRNGAIEIRKRTKGGDEQVLATLGRFAMLGEMSLITDHPRNAAAVAKGPTALFRIRKEPFVDLLKKESLPAYKICLAICRFLAHRLGLLDEKLLDLIQGSQVPESRAKLREFTDFKAKLFSQWKEDPPS